MMNYLKLKSLFLIISAAALCSCGNEATHEEEKKSVIGTNQPLEEVSNEELPSDEFSFSIIEVENGWGYDIFQNGQLYIHQPHIPAISGIQSFRSEADAQACAELAIHKVKNGVVPPTLSVHEMDSLGIQLPQ